MSEREPSINNDLDPEKFPNATRKGALLVGTSAGVITGGVTFFATNAMNSQYAEEMGSIVFSSTTLLLAGRMSYGISLNEAEVLKEKGELRKMRAKITQACFESSAGITLLAGATMNAITHDIGHTALGIAVGVATGSADAIEEWRKRNRRFPDLIMPQGNSTVRDLSYPERNNAYKLPPVFIADSLKDFKEFREINKKRIVEWSREVPLQDDKLSELENSPLLLTSVVLLPNIRHYPAMDPEDEGVIKLMDSDEHIEASHVRDSSPFWANETAFEDDIIGLRAFDGHEWQRYRNRSWMKNIVLLAQYRNTEGKSRSSKKVNLDAVMDRYWLIDIDDNDGDYKEEEPQIEVKVSAVPNTIFQT